MKKLILLVAAFIILAPSMALAVEDCGLRGGCECGGTGTHKGWTCLGSHSSCQEVCDPPSNSSGGSSSGGGFTPQDQMLLQGAGMLGRALGEALRGNPEADAKRQAEADRAAALQRQADEQRKAEALRQQELAKQRILGALKGSESSSDLRLKTDSDSTLTVTETRGAFGSTVITPAKIDAPPAEHGLQLKLGDDADRSSVQAGQGFDTAGKIMGSNLPPPPPTGKSPAEKAQLLDALKAKLKMNEAEEQSLKDQLARLRQAPTPDPVAIGQIQEKIVVKETEKKKIMLDLTADDPDAPGTGSSPNNIPADGHSAGSITTGAPQ